MEINNDILSSLALINSSEIDQDDLVEIFEQCNKTLTRTQSENEETQQQTSTDNKAILRNILSFSISSLLLEAVKNNVSSASLVRILQEHKLDCSTENVTLFIKFINTALEKAHHNVSRLEMNPLPKFRGIEWSQLLEVKSSSMDSIKEKTYLVDILVDKQGEQSTRAENTADCPTDVFSMSLSQKELQDLHLTLRDCAKSIENFLGK